MTTVQRTALVPYTPEEMFTLVNDVDAYAHFLPWCGGGRVIQRTEGEMVAEISIDFKGVRQSFTTCNRMVPNELVNMSLVRGPFRQLQGEWKFEAVGEEGNACRISLHVDFEFSNPITRMAMGTVFGQIVRSMVDAFVKRANQVYGQKRI